MLRHNIYIFTISKSVHNANQDVRERSNITSAGFVQTWNPPPCISKSAESNPHTPYIDDVITSSRVVKSAIFFEDTTLDNSHNCFFVIHFFQDWTKFVVIFEKLRV